MNLPHRFWNTEIKLSIISSKQTFPITCASRVADQQGSCGRCSRCVPSMLALGSPSAPVAWPAAAARLSAQPAVLGQRVFMEPGSSPASGHFPERCGGKAVHLVWKAARDIPVCALSQEGPRLVLESTLKCRF